VGWKLHEQPFPFTIVGEGITRQKPGTCWRVPLSFVPGSSVMSGSVLRMDGVPIGEANAPLLSPEFKSSGRDYLIFIKIPGTDFGWCPDYLYGGSDHGWTVYGTLPSVTINPSINHEGIYHGWVTNGELTDDIEGREYDSRGRLLTAVNVGRAGHE
jgi:hypothetical protein